MAQADAARPVASVNSGSFPGSTVRCYKIFLVSTLRRSLNDGTDAGDRHRATAPESGAIDHTGRSLPCRGRGFDVHREAAPLRATMQGFALVTTRAAMITEDP